MDMDVRMRVAIKAAHDAAHNARAIAQNYQLEMAAFNTTHPGLGTDPAFDGSLAAICESLDDNVQALTESLDAAANL